MGEGSDGVVHVEGMGRPARADAQGSLRLQVHVGAVSQHTVKFLFEGQPEGRVVRLRPVQAAGIN